MSKEIMIGFGAALPDLSAQIKQQGFPFDAQKMKHFQKVRDSIMVLRFADLLTDSETNKMQNKLFKKIVYHINNYKS